MALPPINLPAVSRLVLHYSDSASGATAVNVMHVLSSGATALDTFNRFSTAWTAANIAQACTTTRLHTIDVTKLDNATATSTFSTVGTNWDGGQVGEHDPGLAMLIKYTTGFRGLASIGHTYAPFVAESVNENGRIASASLSSFQSAWVALVNALTSQTIPLQVVSAGRESTGTLPAAPAVNHTVTGASVDPVLSQQRERRGRLRG